jgi:hypothetical protein
MDLIGLVAIVLACTNILWMDGPKTKLDILYDKRKPSANSDFSLEQYHMTLQQYM